jgi:hypothetical protein
VTSLLTSGSGSDRIGQCFHVRPQADYLEINRLLVVTEIPVKARDGIQLLPALQAQIG